MVGQQRIRVVARTLIATRRAAGLDRYFEEILALVAAGTFSEEELRRLRLRYDTEEPDDVPPGHWSEPR